LNILGVAGLNAGLKWIEKKGLQNIHEQEMKLIAMLRDGLLGADDISIYCQDDLAGHISIFSFNVNGLEAVNTSTMLDVDYNIASRSGLHCAPLVHEQLGTDKIHGAVRFGIGPFNTEEDIRTAIEAVKEIAEFQRRKSS
jgi:selenocysteine lyase/cysteine desulfurase